MIEVIVIYSYHETHVDPTQQMVFDQSCLSTFMRYSYLSVFFHVESLSSNIIYSMLVSHSPFSPAVVLKLPIEFRTSSVQYDTEQFFFGNTNSVACITQNVRFVFDGALES